MPKAKKWEVEIINKSGDNIGPLDPVDEAGLRSALESLISSGKVGEDMTVKRIR
jgi:hypothetical protein